MSPTDFVEFSSDVLIQLQVNGELLRVGQVCDNVLYLREPRSAPVGDAELLITVNGKQKVHRIFLPHGIDTESDAVEFF
jgi:hypothetical protein